MLPMKRERKVDEAVGRSDFKRGSICTFKMATTTENIILVLPDIVKEMTLQGQQYSLIV